MTDVTEQKSSNTLGVVALVLAIVGLVCTISLIGLPIGIICLFVALVLGIIALFRQPRGKAITSVILSLLGLISIIWAGIWFISVVIGPVKDFSSRIKEEIQTNIELRIVANEPGFGRFLENRIEDRFHALNRWAVDTQGEGLRNILWQYVDFALAETKQEVLSSVDAWIQIFGLPRSAEQEMIGNETYIPGINEGRLDDDAPFIVGGDRDEHGCIPSAGYAWNEEAQECQRPWEQELSIEEINTLVNESTVQTEIINEVEEIINSL